MFQRLSLILAVLTPLFLFSQQEEIELLKLGAQDLNMTRDTGKIQITSASRSSKFLQDLPVTVYVIPRSEILENGYITLGDVLKDVPGVKVSQPGSGIQGETFLMNGLFGNYYCKVMINGIPITPSVVSGISISGNLPIRQAERIEIISGPSSALYGSDAIAGVINIITKQSDRPVWAQTDLTMGSQGFYNMNVMIGGKFGKNKNVAEYNLYGNYSQQNDMNIKYDVPGNYNPQIYNTRDDDSAHLQANYRGTETSPKFDKLPMTSSLLGFGLKYRGLSVNYDHLFRRTHSSIGQSTNHVGYYDPSSFWGESIDRLSLSYKKTWGKISSSTLFSYVAYRMDNNSNFQLIADRGNNGIVYKYSASDDFFFDQILSYAVNKNLELDGGFSFQYSGNLPITNDLYEPFDKDAYGIFDDKVDVTDTLLGNFGYNPINFYNVAGYFQLFYNVGRISFQGGLRWDEHSLFGSNLTPKIGLQYKVNKKLSIRTNYGHGFRAPSLYYVYNSIAYAVETEDGTKIRYENLPNPNVQPERFRAFEMGMRYKPISKVDVEFIFMYHKMKDNITSSIVVIDPELYPNSDTTIALSAVNDKNSKAELYSAQINIRATDLVPSLKLNSNLFITLSKGKEILPNGLGTLNDYRNMPNWMVQWQVDLQVLNKWVVILHNNFSSSWKKRFFPLPLETMEQLNQPIDVKGFYTLDMINRFKINRNFHAFLTINNVFNTRYGGNDAYGGLYDLVYNPQYGFNFKLGFSFTME